MKGESMRRKQAPGWAQHDNVTVVLIEHRKERTAAGGYQELHGPVRPPQTFGIALQTETSTTPASEGTARAAELILVGPVGALVAVGDTFTYQGLEMRVFDVRNAPDGVYARAVHDGR